MREEDIYKSGFVKGLFNEMSKTYGLANIVSSFGFCTFWRRKCVSQIDLKNKAVVCDLMSGMGECWESIDRKIDDQTKLIGVDFSSEMCRRSKANIGNLKKAEVEVLEEDVLANSLESNSVDCVISSFGLKTFSDEQNRKFAAEIARILRPNGTFSLLEISVPPNSFLQFFYMFYLKRIIPTLGRLFLGNPDNYRMLGIYTEKFENCSKMADFLRERKLDVEYKTFFFGCASGLVGRKLSTRT
jgi:demethylmenaquinone methyltransferase/2-methoxy-6-polyprenyl-1,4-benzoquinol methylase